MAESKILDPDAEREVERAQLAELAETLNSITRMQRLFLCDVERPGELDQTEGRRCLLVIEGLKYHPGSAFYFQVTPAGVEQVPPYDTYDTAIVAPLKSVLSVLKATVAGRQDPFGDELSRGNARLKGESRIHDGWVFKDVFIRLAARFRRYQETVR